MYGVLHAGAGQVRACDDLAKSEGREEEYKRLCCGGMEQEAGNRAALSEWRVAALNPELNPSPETLNRQ